VSHFVIVWRRWLCFRCNCAPKKEGFFCCGSFLLSQPAAGVHVRIYLPAARARRAGAATRRPKQLFRAESFGGWGVLSC
jgi:hypothetical protein